MAPSSPLAQAASFSPGSRTALSYLDQLLTQRNVDPAAANAVFGQEGASGGIGDGGHAFGPGQFNDAGGVWTGKYPGMSPQEKNAVAWSQPGLQELARHVASVAGGLHGSDAVHAIVGDTQVGGHYTGFERPANEGGEISRALASLGMGGGQSFAPASGGLQQPTLAAAAQPQPRFAVPAQQQPNTRAFAQTLLGGISPTGQIDQQGLLAALLARRS